MAAALSGITLLALAELAGVVLYQRLLNGSTSALAITLAVVTVVGGYAGWLLGVVVYSAVRGGGEEAASGTS